MKVDYIIVGLGLAGMSFSHELEKLGKSFVVFDDASQNSSIVAGGMYNPVILKRFTPVWNAIEQLEKALPFYEELEQKLQSKFHFKVNIHRIFKSVEEQNNWFVASDKPKLSPFMVPELFSDRFDGIKSEFGYGKLQGTGRIDTAKLLSEYEDYLKKKNFIRAESFNYDEISFLEESVSYKNISASKIVFCEGFGLKQNSFFNYLPMQEAKGELLIIHAPNLKIDFLIKAAVFVMPLGNDLYKVGATFNWNDKTKLPTTAGEKELVNKLNSFLTTPYTIVKHLAGIRPTVKDRRPLVGVHKKFKQLAVLNGLGTRGVMIAPKAAKDLLNYLENDIPLDDEVSIDRFH